ncbi:MAG: hypothetical protein K8W52_01055 [Deltaproteobacteria bacterium]|nr:hypothetical protein [Deltaproteobacteria bacterium]
MNATVIWDLETDAPELVPHVPGADGLLQRLRGPLALPASTVAVGAGQIRPNGHDRAFYQEVDGGVVALKGSEPTCGDFPAWVERMAKGHVHVEIQLGTAAIDTLLSRAELRAIDKWPLIEGKVPGACTVREALAEARAAAAFQRAHVARYGTAARVPLPLAVLRWPDEVVAQAAAALRPHLAERTRPIVEHALADGLGAYAYFYPMIPYRLWHLTVRDAVSGGYPARRDAMAGHLDARVIVERWIELVARMLACGFVPKDPGALPTGDCLQPQNAIIDGGFADVESLVPSTGLDDRALADALRRTIAELAATITRFLLGRQAATPAFRDRMADLHAHVWAAIARQLGADPPVDPRIASLVAPASAWEGLDRICALAFP